MKAPLAALLLLVGPAFAQAPDADSDEAGLILQVARAEDDIRNSANLIHDQALNAYIQGVACRVAAANCPALRLYLVEAPGMRVLALPNGALVVSSGTLLRTGNEAELAHLLAHEIAHYLHKDTLGQFHRRLDTSGAVALLGVAASGIGAGFVGTPASMAALGATYAYSQSEEEAAQRTGFDLAVAAGYDPNAAAAVWRNADSEFLQRHPGGDRPALLESLARSAPAGRSWQLGAESHADAIAPYRFRWVEDELRQGADQVALFSRLSAGGSGLYRYALGEAYRKRGLPGDMALAEQAFRTALSSPDAPALAWRGLGLMAMQMGDKDTARTAFARYRAALPDADDKAMIDYYLKQL
ncbi:MAG TPA: M48 family metalloprotease [Rhizomicrobium sp.]|nr:M48 family metalloprotease [Rhizomicrobium sp.]